MLLPYINIIGRKKDHLTSGIVFFYGSLFYIIHFTNWGSHIEDIFLYNILYMLVDNYIDNPSNEELKSRVIEQMFILIEDPLKYRTLALEDPVLETIALVYHKLISRCPNIKSSMIALFKAEIEGLYIQRTSKLDRETYYNIALKKGGYTMLVLQAIMQDTTTDNVSFQIGSIMQLIDDIIDTSIDKASGINTIATYDLEEKGSLDELWMDIARRIAAVDRRFTIFIVLYHVFAMYIPDRYPENYSARLRSFTTTMNLFDYGKGCDSSSLLSDSLMNELARQTS